MQVVAEGTKQELEAARAAYAPAGSRNAVLFFCARDLAAVDPMYQFSLAWFIQLYVRSIQVRSQDEHRRLR